MTVCMAVGHSIDGAEYENSCVLDVFGEEGCNCIYVYKGYLTFYVVWQFLVITWVLYILCRSKLVKATVRRHNKQRYRRMMMWSYPVLGSVLFLMIATWARSERLYSQGCVPSPAFDGYMRVSTAILSTHVIYIGYDVYHEVKRCHRKRRQII
jgi:hypothetical protein